MSFLCACMFVLVISALSGSEVYRLDSWGIHTDSPSTGDQNLLTLQGGYPAPCSRRNGLSWSQQESFYDLNVTWGGVHQAVLNVDTAETQLLYQRKPKSKDLSTDRLK